MPSAPVYLKRKKLLWYQKPTKYGTSNVVISELNFWIKYLKKHKQETQFLRYIPGRLENSYMITASYEPFLSKQNQTIYS